jgi:hypothetical protein
MSTGGSRDEDNEFAYLFDDDEDDDDDDDDDENWTATTSTPTRRTAPSNRSEANSHPEPPPEAERPQAAPQEEDGHPNLDGVSYVQPKAPFVGTYWSPLENAFLRIDRANTPRPRGGRPQGYVFVFSISGFRRTLAQTLLDEQRIAQDARNRQQPHRPGQAQAIFGSDVPNATLLEISWYISACGHHAPRQWFRLMSAAWTSAVDDSGHGAQVMQSYERGERKELGHLQGISRVLTHEGMKERIRRWMRAALMISSGQYRCKIGINFFTNQEWDFMGGYVQKDMGKAHYLFFAYPTLPESK